MRKSDKANYAALEKELEHRGLLGVGNLMNVPSGLDPFLYVVVGVRMLNGASCDYFRAQPDSYGPRESVMGRMANMADEMIAEDGFLCGAVAAYDMTDCAGERKPKRLAIMYCKVEGARCHR